MLRFLSTHLLPRPQDPFEIPELNLRPVATPRAPVQPDPVPAISPASSRVSLPSPSTSGSVSVAQVYTPVGIISSRPLKTPEDLALSCIAGKLTNFAS